MREFVQSDEVTALLTEAGSHGQHPNELLSGVNSAVCDFCGRRENLHEVGPSLSVILEVTRRPGGRDMIAISFAHIECSPSVVVTGHPDEIEPRMHDLLVNLPVMDGVPLLIFAPFLTVPREMWTQHFLDVGYVASSPAFADLPLLHGWSVDIGGSEVRLVAPPQEETLTFSVEPGPEWLAAIGDKRRCLAVTGSIDLEDFDMRRFLAMLDGGDLAVAMVITAD